MSQIDKIDKIICNKRDYKKIKKSEYRNLNIEDDDNTVRKIFSYLQLILEIIDSDLEINL